MVFIDFTFKNGYWKLLAEKLVYNKWKRSRSCFYYSLFEQEQIGSGYCYLLLTFIP